MYDKCDEYWQIQLLGALETELQQVRHDVVLASLLDSFDLNKVSNPPISINISLIFPAIEREKKKEKSNDVYHTIYTKICSYIYMRIHWLLSFFLFCFVFPPISHINLLNSINPFIQFLFIIILPRSCFIVFIVFIALLLFICCLFQTEKKQLTSSLRMRNSGQITAKKTTISTHFVFSKGTLFKSDGNIAFEYSTTDGHAEVGDPDSPDSPSNPSNPGQFSVETWDSVIII